MNKTGGDKMKIKTYPLQFTEEYLKKIADLARENDMSIKDFIHMAISDLIGKLGK